MSDERLHRGESEAPEGEGSIPGDQPNRPVERRRWLDDDALRLLDWVERDPWGSDGDQQASR